MFETAFALSLTQFARSLSFPERLQHRPARNAALEPWRLRNTGLDALFYDVKALTAEETFYISDSLASEGLIMIVPPSGGAMLTICDSVAEYKLRGGRDVHALAVAGIGGSFFFGWLGHMRNDLEVIDDVVGRPHLGAYEDRHKLALKAHPSALDTDTVETLLADPGLSFHLLAGHSRGNRVLSEALYAIKEEDKQRLRALADGLRIVTFGGRITMPPDCRDVIDVIGELDWFGEINSRPQIDSDIRVPLAGHSTNTDFAGALQVTRILKDIIARSLPAVTEQTDTTLPAVPVAEAPTVSPIPEPEAEASPDTEFSEAQPAVETAAEPIEPLASEEIEQPAAVEEMAETDAAIADSVAPLSDADEEQPIASLEPIAQEASPGPAAEMELEPTPAPDAAVPHRTARGANARHKASKPKTAPRR